MVVYKYKTTGVNYKKYYLKSIISNISIIFKCQVYLSILKATFKDNKAEKVISLRIWCEYTNK